jgi:hypothetical protein
MRSALPPPYSSNWTSSSAAFGAVPRNRPGVRVGLLQLVGGAVDDVLEHLLLGALGLHVAGKRRAGILGDDLLQGGANGLQLRRFGRRHQLGHRFFEGPLQRRAEGEQRRRPLPAFVDALDRAVVEFVGDVEGELQIVVGQRVAGLDQARAGEARVRRTFQGLEQLLAEGAPGRRQLDQASGHGSGPLGALNPISLWVPSQNGRMRDLPQRQSAIVRRSTGSSFPSWSVTVKSPRTR